MVVVGGRRHYKETWFLLSVCLSRLSPYFVVVFGLLVPFVSRRRLLVLPPPARWCFVRPPFTFACYASARAEVDFGGMPS